MNPLNAVQNVPPKGMRQAAVYGYLIRECLSLTVDTMAAVSRVWGLEETDVFRLGICSCPSNITNLIASHACAQKFGELFDVQGFYVCEGCWLLDIDPRLARRGLIVPARNRQLSIVSLRVFRHIRDERPFLLRLRYERDAA